jgi:hypothetical protein
VAHEKPQGRKRDRHDQVHSSARILLAQQRDHLALVLLVRRLGEVEILGVQADRTVGVEGGPDRVLHREDLRQQPRLRIQEHHDPARLHLTDGTRGRTAEQGEQGHE